LLENVTLLPVYALIKHPSELLDVVGFYYTTIYHTINKKEKERG